MDNNKFNLETNVYFALGQASMCWSEIPNGIFQSERCNKVAEELVESIENDVASATKILMKNLHRDPSLYCGYQANIAVQFQDECRRQNMGIENNLLHQISNNAARNFLDLLINLCETKNENAQSREILFEKMIITRL